MPKKTRITIVCQDYKPTRIASTVRVERIAKILTKKYKVTIITGFPVFNQESLPKKYQGKFYTRDIEDGVEVYRTYTYFSKSNSFFARTWCQLSFMFSSILVGLFIKSDLIIATSPPLFAAFSGATISFLKQVKFIFDVRDLWPESMVVLGVLKNKLFIFGAEIMESLTYKQATAINVVTPNILNRLRKRLPHKKINLLMNATDTNYFKPKKVSKEKYGFKKSDFIILYTGNFGRAQSLDKVLDAAKILSKKKSVKFLLVGKGTDEDRLKKIARPIKNVQFMEYQPKEIVLDLINISNVCLISLAKKKLFEGAIPSKTFEYMACKKVVLASAKGDIEKIIKNGITGIVTPPEDPKQLAQAIEDLQKNPQQAQTIAEKAFDLVSKNFSENAFSNNLKRTL